MKRNIILASALICLHLSCKKEPQLQEQFIEKPITKTYTQLEKANWFIGEWGNKSAEGDLTERWKKGNDSVYDGESYFVTAKSDTVFAEHIKLEEANGKLTYIVTVPNQNNGEAVHFEMTSGTENQLVFENPKHDFPNKIMYNKVGNDSLVAEIFGTKKGKLATEKFSMKRR